jgi:hypothetical protein
LAYFLAGWWKDNQFQASPANPRFLLNQEQASRQIKGAYSTESLRGDSVVAVQRELLMKAMRFFSLDRIA